MGNETVSEKPTNKPSEQGAQTAGDRAGEKTSGNPLPVGGKAPPEITKATRAHKDVGAAQDEQKRREFMHAMLGDLRALDRMLREGRFDSGPRRIGAEQEMFLIDR